MTKGVPRVSEKGNVVSMSPEAHAPDVEAQASTPGNTSLPRSSGPCSSIATQLPGESSGGGALSSVSRSGKSAQAEGTGTGIGRSGRCAARRVSPLPKKEPRDSSEKEEGHGPRPCEERELDGSARTSFSLQKSVGGIGPRIHSRRAPQKGWWRERTGA